MTNVLQLQKATDYQSIPMTWLNTRRCQSCAIHWIAELHVTCSMQIASARDQNNEAYNNIVYKAVNAYTSIILGPVDA